MSDKFNESEVKKYQAKLDEKRRLRRNSSLSHSTQQELPAGSSLRDRQGYLTNKLWDQAEDLNKELISAGVLDRRGSLTPKARNSGLFL